ncbi:hypothetical protein [Schaalia suimastitidis]|uniref:hypothetical protein n=1 Tax=Schaalia suimastitidis TaxID=121163 RepID=UPI000414D5C4|nr:hypothetical protein [Schaalia suimastitidis]
MEQELHSAPRPATGIPSRRRTNQPPPRKALSPGLQRVLPMLAASLGLTALTMLAGGLPWGVWVLFVALVGAAVCLAIFWPRLTGVPVTLVGQCGIALGSAGPALAVVFTKDLYWATLVTATAVALLISAEVLTAPKPVDHSPMDSDSDEEVPPEALLVASQLWGSRSTTSVIAASVTGMLFTACGAAWIGLLANVQWAFAVPLLAVSYAVATTSASLHLSRSLRYATIYVLTVVAGISGMYLETLVGSYGSAAGLTLPILGTTASVTTATLLVGSVVGAVVATVIVTVDVIFGDVLDRPGWERAAIAALQFLLVAFPVYALIRLG